MDSASQVRDLPVYLAIASNSSGATPKDLFDDAVEDLKRKVLDSSSKQLFIFQNIMNVSVYMMS